MNKKFESVPTIITGKDLDYLSDMFNWNYLALKKVKDFKDRAEDQEIVSEGIANSINSDEEMMIVKTLNDAKDIIHTLRMMDVDIVLSDIITKNI